MAIETDLALGASAVFICAAASAAVVLYRFNVIEWAHKVLEKPDYQLAYETQMYLQVYDKIKESRNHVPYIRMEAEIRKLERECDDACRRRMEAQAIYDGKQKAKQDSVEYLQRTWDKNIEIMSRSFSKQFVDNLETFLGKHPETLADLLTVANLRYSDDVDNMVHQIDSYLRVMGYLNNFMVDEHKSQEDAQGTASDLETFLTHRRVGVKEAMLLKTRVYDIRAKGLPSLNEQKEVREKWAHLQYPIQNLLTTIHKTVVPATTM
jgi:hypothetical protein